MLPCPNTAASAQPEHPELEGLVLLQAQNKHPQAQGAGCLFPVRLSVKLNQHMKAPGIYSNDKSQASTHRVRFLVGISNKLPGKQRNGLS